MGMLDGAGGRGRCQRLCAGRARLTARCCTMQFVPVHCVPGTGHDTLQASSRRSSSPGQQGQLTRPSMKSADEGPITGTIWALSSGLRRSCGAGNTGWCTLSGVPPVALRTAPVLLP